MADPILAAEHKAGRKGYTSGGKAWGLWWTHSKPQPDNRGGYWALSRATLVGLAHGRQEVSVLDGPGPA